MEQEFELTVVVSVEPFSLFLKPSAGGFNVANERVDKPPLHCKFNGKHIRISSLLGSLGAGFSWWEAWNQLNIDHTRAGFS